MPGGCAIYIGDQHLQQRTNPFGKDVANRGLYRALIKHGPWDDQMFLAHMRVDARELGLSLFDGEVPPKPVLTTSVLNHKEIADRGVFLRGQASIAELSWMRRAKGDRDYSFVGLIHSLAPQAMRAYIADVLTTPVEPWDALICTSPAVERHLRTMLTETADFLASRFSTPDARRTPPLPQLPVIPLGIDTGAFARRGDPARRTPARQALGIDDDVFTLLWVGRLSFFEKAYPQGMFAAAEQVAQRIGRPVRFLMAGWFPAAERGKHLWEEVAALYAPSVDVGFLDGNDPKVMDLVWPAADVFVSMVDNTQETFGITPIEAMAAGLPVVVSDWDGYRFTVHDGVTGFRVPTLISPPGTGELMAQRHALGMDTYQFYGAQVASHVAVNVRAAADALTTLAKDPDRARAVGAAARDHARARFDWSVVIPQYADLFEDLAKSRAAAPAHEQGPVPRGNPVRNDPFTAFADFATESLSGGIRLHAAATPAQAAAHHDATLNSATAAWRLPAGQSSRILALAAERGGITVDDLAAAMAAAPRDNLRRHVVWMCKVGLLDWEPAAMVAVDEVDDRA
ncbi:MAG: glycosyltransferase family 4 protein [Thalassobaculaceae bacterium]|nr:glycosyltransferase family 4 protein [Thalassobaculaceae bacterium]